MDRKEDRPVFYYKMDPNICVLKLTPGLNPSVFLWIMEQVPGVILEGYGEGGIPCYLKEVFYQSMQERTEKGFITMMATQAFLEGTAMDTYEVGREAKRKTGIIECEDMTIEAAAAKMMWSLGQSEKEKE